MLFGCLSTVVFIALAAMITRQHLWSILTGPALPETPAVVSRAPVVGALSLTSVPALSPTPATPGLLGQINNSGAWRVVVDQVDVSPDETLNGWLQVVVTCTFQNQSAVAASLPIPSTAAKPDPTRTTPGAEPSFQAMPAVPENAPSVVNGLRLYLVDSGRRQFGGGFGGTNGGYDLILAPGDVARLAYHFRFPRDVGAPSLLRVVFPASAGGRSYEIHLDHNNPTATLAANPSAPRQVVGERVSLSDGWRVQVDGVEFGPAAEPGERPVTVHLQVENLTDNDQPALTDPADPRGELRDFYLGDDVGHLAYSHADDMPGVIVPAHATRPVTVKLYTLDLASWARPLYFTAVLNWQSNHYAQFRIEE